MQLNIAYKEKYCGNLYGCCGKLNDNIVDQMLLFP